MTSGAGDGRSAVVIFDVGNVLIEWDSRHLYRKLFLTEAEVDWFLANICTMDWNLEQDRGRSWAEAVAELTALHPEWATQISAYDQRWTEMVPGQISASVEVLQNLKASGQKIYAITNFSHEKWAVSQARFEFLTYFDGVIVSAHEKLLKPDPAIYQCLLQRYELAAEDCVFVDDSEKNILAAKALGMKTVHFRPATNLSEELRALGVAI